MTDYDNDEARNVDEVEDRIISMENTEYVRQRQDGRGKSVEMTLQPQQTSQFDDVKTTERITTIDLASSFGTSELRDVIMTSGSGAVSPDPDLTTGEMVLKTGTTTGSSVSLQSAETGRYTPGHSAEVGIGVREATNGFQNDEVVKWGYYVPDGDGFFFGKDVNPADDTVELFVGIQQGGVNEKKVYRRDWNGADVDSQLGRETNLLTEGTVFQINYTWYGYGVIEYSVVTQDENNEQKTIILHREVRFGHTSIADPNSRITVEADNGSTARDVEIRVGGRQFSILGSAPSEERITAQTRLGPDGAGTGSWTYVMGWTREDGSFNSRFDVSSIDALQNDNARYALFFVNPEFVNTAVTGQSFGLPENVKDSETLLRVDTSGSFNNISQANKVWEGNSSGASNTSGELNTENLSTNLPQDGQLILAVRGTSASVDVEAATMRMQEDW